MNAVVPADDFCSECQTSEVRGEGLTAVAEALAAEADTSDDEIDERAEESA